MVFVKQFVKQIFVKQNIKIKKNFIFFGTRSKRNHQLVLRN